MTSGNGTAPIVPSTIKLWGSAGLYLVEIPSAALRLRFDHFEESKSGITTEVTAFSTLDAERPRYKWTNRHNLLAGRSKGELAKRIEATVGALVDAVDMVDKLSGQIVERHRAGEPVVNLAEVVPAPMRWRCWPLLPEGLPALFVAEGGIGKTTVGAIIAAAVCSGVGLAGLRPTRGRVLVLDYESSAEDMARLVHGIWTGMGIETPPEIYYRSCSRRFVDEQEQIREIVTEQRIDLVIVDTVSKAAACEDENKAGPVSLYYQALRTLGWTDEQGVKHMCTTLNHAHTQKGDGDNKSARGSGNWQDQARSVWRLSKSDDSNSHEIGLYDVKRNLRRQMQPLGFRVEYAYGEATAEYERPLTAVTVSRADVRDVPTLAAKLKLHEQVANVLRRGKSTVTELRETMGMKPMDDQQIRNALLNHPSTFLRCGVGDDGKTVMWGLVTTQPVEVNE